MSVATYAAAQLLRVLPRVRITRAVGRLADARIPAPLSRAVVGLFVRAYKVDLDEAIRPTGEFESFDAFFTRALKPGSRVPHTDERLIVSPADGRLDALGRIERDGTLQVKGRPYSVSELLDDPREVEAYQGGSFAVVYLSPRDYHRVHAPVAGKIGSIRSLPGDLFPVNAIGERHIRSLFSINRRVVIPIDSPVGRITVVMVGAMIVGRITVIGVDERDVPIGLHSFASPKVVERGDEIGVFHLGSTAVVLTPPGAPILDRASGPIRLGEAMHTS